jgi:mono/diheme cytochrome c family protein
VIRSRRRWPGSVLSLALLAATAVAADDAALRGRGVFETQCAVCHGLTGDGQGPEAHRFTTHPTDLRRALFKFRSTPTGSLPTDADLERTIRRGLPGSGMIAQDHLSESEVRDVVAYLKTLSPRWRAGRPRVAIAVARPADRETLATKGAGLFRDAGCIECHGESGRGDGPSAGKLTSGGRPTRPPDLTRRPFKGGDEVEDVYRALAAEPQPTDDERIGREVEAAHQPGRRR